MSPTRVHGTISGGSCVVEAAKTTLPAAAAIAARTIVA
jgi:hypothetical protein